MTVATPAHDFRRTLPALLALALSSMVSFAVMGSFATVQEAAKRELRLSDTELSFITGVSAAVPLLLLSLPIGIAVDRFNRVRILVALALVWTAGTVLTAFAAGIPALFVARMMTAIGMAGALTAALSIAADLCVPATRGRANLIVNLGKIGGQAAGFAIVGALFAWFGQGRIVAGLSGWRATHLVLGIFSAVLIVPLLFLREPARGETEAGTRPSARTLARELWSRRAFLAPLFAGQMSVVMADAAAGIWAAPVLTRRFGLQPGDFAGWMGLLMLGAGLAGSILGGLGADFGMSRPRKGGLLVGAVMAAALGIPAALFPIAPGVTSLAVAMGVLATCGAVTGLVMAVALTVYLPNEVRGLTIGAFIALAGLFGFGVAPPVVALVSGVLGGEAHLPAALAIVGVVTSMVGFGGFVLAMRRAPVR
jgi:predicted MFS family arabinose efflux permease